MCLCLQFHAHAGERKQNRRQMGATVWRRRGGGDEPARDPAGYMGFYDVAEGNRRGRCGKKSRKKSTPFPRSRCIIISCLSVSIRTAVFVKPKAQTDRSTVLQKTWSAAPAGTEDIGFIPRKRMLPIHNMCFTHINDMGFEKNRAIKALQSE